MNRITQRCCYDVYGRSLLAASSAAAPLKPSSSLTAAREKKHDYTVVGPVQVHLPLAAMKRQSCACQAAGPRATCCGNSNAFYVEVWFTTADSSLLVGQVSAEEGTHLEAQVQRLALVQRCQRLLRQRPAKCVAAQIQRCQPRPQCLTRRQLCGKIRQRYSHKCEAKSQCTVCCG